MFLLRQKPESIEQWCTDNAARHGTEGWPYWQYCIRARDNDPNVKPRPVNFDAAVGPTQDNWVIDPADSSRFILKVIFEDDVGNQGSATTKFESGRINILRYVLDMVEERDRSNARSITILSLVVGILLVYIFSANASDIIDAITILIAPSQLGSDHEGFRRGYDLLLWIRNPCSRPSERSRMINLAWSSRDN
jgi:hypothetical protein